MVDDGTVSLLLSEDGSSGNGVGTNNLSSDRSSDNSDDLGLSSDHDDHLVRVGFNLGIGHSLASGLGEGNLKISDQLTFSDLKKIGKFVKFGNLGGLVGSVNLIRSGALVVGVGSNLVNINSNSLGVHLLGDLDVLIDNCLAGDNDS